MAVALSLLAHTPALSKHSWGCFGSSHPWTQLVQAGKGQDGRPCPFCPSWKLLLQFSQELMGTHIDVPRLYHTGLPQSLGEGSCPSPAPVKAGGDGLVQQLPVLG